jgi:PAS domain S-box-containing protein
MIPFKANFIPSAWNTYKSYIRGVVLPNNDHQIKDITYWRNEIFCNILTYFAPLTIIALVPSVYMSFMNGLPVVGVADLIAFAFVIHIMVDRGLALWLRKSILIFILYCVSVILLFYLSMTGAGLLFLLTTTIFSAVIYSSAAALHSAWLNTAVCIFFGLLIYFRIDIPITHAYDTGTWIAISSNLVLLSFVCAVCLSLILNGLETSMGDKLLVEKDYVLSNERLLFHIENSPMGFMEWDSELKIKSWSKRAEEIFGWTETEFAAMLKDGLTQVYADDISWVSKMTNELIAGSVEKNTLQCRHYTKDGRVIWCEWFNSTLKNEDGATTTMLSLVNDITQQKEQQKKLSFSESSLSAIIESTDAYIFSLDTNFRYITFNKGLKNSVKRRYGIDVSPGDSAFDFLEKSEPEEVIFWRNTYSEALTGKSLQFEKSFHIGDFYNTTSFSINPIIENESIIGLSCFAADITDRKIAELKIQELNDKLELKVLERTAQLESVNKELEAFSYSVSHDLRAPLRSVNGFAQILKEDHSKFLSAEALRITNNIINSGKRMGILIDDLLSFSRLGRKELAKAIISMEQLVTGICDELKRENPDRDIEFRIQHLPLAKADNTAIKQVWINLISNAVKYSGLKEKTIIEIGSEENEKEITYFVKDNGAGFDMRYANKLFGVFQRLHDDEEFEGTGVGLAIVQRVINKHGGRVWAEGKVNEGAAFYFTLNKS